MTRPSKKLDYRNLDPFRIKRYVGKYAYGLELPTPAFLATPSLQQDQGRESK